MIFCPDPWAQYEAHNDHIVTGRAAAQAFLSSSCPGIPGHADRSLAGGRHRLLLHAEAEYGDRCDQTFETKFAAMAEHRTQLNEELLGLYRIYFSMQGQKLAEGKDFALGEGFKVLGPLHMHCFTEAPEI